MFNPNKVENEIIARPPYFKNMDDLFDNCLDCNGECVNSCIMPLKYQTISIQLLFPKS